MAVTLYASQTDVEQLLSSFGVAVRADDRDTHANTARILAALEKATCDANIYLFKNYPLAQVLLSSWAKWVTAVFAAVEMCRRRGNPVPASLQAEYDRYLAQLLAVADGSLAMPTDTGLAAPEFDNTPFVTNLVVNGNFPGAAVRRVKQSSTQMPQAPSRKGYDAPTPSYPW